MCDLTVVTIHGNRLKARLRKVHWSCSLEQSDANDRYGAFAVGTHDDLVTALGLAVQTDVPHPGVVSGALYPGRRACEAAGLAVVGAAA